MLPTPNVGASRTRNSPGETARRTPSLGAVVAGLATGDLPLLPTPQARDWKGAPGRGYSLKRGNDLVREVEGLADVVESAGPLLPTPNVAAREVRNSPGEMARLHPALGAVVADLAENGEESQFYGEASLLPTPRAQEPGRTNEGYGNGLSETVVALGEASEDLPLLSTPRATDGGSSTENRNRLLGEASAPLLPTPCAQQSGNSPEEHLRKKPGRRVVTDLAILVENGLLETGGALLPTPNADVGRGVRSPDGIAKRVAKGDKQFSLEDAVALLPTPRAEEFRSGSGASHANGTRKSGATLKEAVQGLSGDELGAALLPTPCVVDRLATTDMTLEQWDESRRSQKERGVGSFGPRGDSLGAAVLRIERGTVDERPDYSSSRRHDETAALLPTPTQSDGTGGGIRADLSWEGTTTKSTGDGGNSRLRDVVGLLGPLLPTPKAHDGVFGTPRTSGRPIEKSTHLQTIVSLLGPLLPTPNAQDGNGGRYSSDGHQSTLPGEVRLLPTPRSSDCFGAGRHGDGGMDLRTAVSLLPTPRSHQRGDCPGERRRQSPDLSAVTLWFPDCRRQGGQTNGEGEGGEVDESTAGHNVSWGKYEPAIRRWEAATRPAPAPTEPNKNGNPRLTARFSEWMMGWPAGWVTDPDIGIPRTAQLRIVGNGVCPQQAYSALTQLLSDRAGAKPEAPATDDPAPADDDDLQQLGLWDAETAAGRP